MSDPTPEQNNQKLTKQALDKTVPDPSRRRFLAKLGVGLGALVAPGFSGLKIPQGEGDKPKTFKELVMGLDWAKISTKEDLGPFIESAVKEYIQVTASPNLTVDQLLSPGKITLYNTKQEFEAAIRQKKPNYGGGDTAFTDFDNNLAFFDVETLRLEAKRLGSKDGVGLSRLIFHELGHLDLRLKTDGHQINNPNYYFPNSRTQEREPYFLYRGFQVYTTNSNYGFNVVEEVTLDVLANRLLIEKVGLPADRVDIFTRDSKYYRNGADVLLPFFRKYIPLSELYTLHATSDFDGVIKRIGGILPGSNDEIDKGWELFIGVQDKSLPRIASTGVNGLISR